MRIVDIRLRTVPISRYADPAVDGGGLDTTAVAVVTDVERDGGPVVGFGFSSIGRFGQSGLIRDRFAPRLLAADDGSLTTASGDDVDPFRAWDRMMDIEKPGGHGERCVAVGTLDMAVWDAASKIAGSPCTGSSPTWSGVPVPRPRSPCTPAAGTATRPMTSRA